MIEPESYAAYSYEAAKVVIKSLEKIGKKDRAALTEEGERLIRFVEPTVKSFEVRFAE